MATILQQPGLYKIQIGPKFYYGSSKNLYNRHYQHLPELRHNKHKNKYMQAAFNKYQTFEFTVLAYCQPEDRRSYENRLLVKFADHPDCMNLTKRTEGPSGNKWSSEARKRHSERMKGNTNGYGGKGVKRTHPASYRENLKKTVSVIDAEGNETIYASMQEASDALGIPKYRISKYCRGEYKSTNTGLIISFGGVN